LLILAGPDWFISYRSTFLSGSSYYEMAKNSRYASSDCGGKQETGSRHGWEDQRGIGRQVVLGLLQLLVWFELACVPNQQCGFYPLPTEEFFFFLRVEIFLL
jgi:hypothetical protein